MMAARTHETGWKRLFPFNAEQTVNILSEFGPLVTMFVVNAMFGIAAGTWALILSTIAAVIAMRIVLQRLPVFPLIASSVTVLFGALTLLTGDATWVQIKVTIFNAMFGGFLFGGLWRRFTYSRLALEAFPILAMLGLSWLFGLEIGALALIFGLGILVVLTHRRPSDFALAALGVTIVFGGFAILSQNSVWLSVNRIALAAMLAGFVLGVMFLKRNFFQYTFEKTFHYTKEGWDSFTRSFAWFFMFTAVLNEVVRLSFNGATVYDVFGYAIDGVNIWIIFKIAFIMPLSGLFAWYLTRIMQRHRLPDAAGVEPAPAYARLGSRSAMPGGSAGKP